MSFPDAPLALARGFFLALALPAAALADVHVVDASGAGDFTVPPSSPTRAAS